MKETHWEFQRRSMNGIRVRRIPLSSFARVYPKNPAKILLKVMRLLNAATIPSRMFGMSVSGLIWMTKRMAIVPHRWTLTLMILRKAGVGATIEALTAVKLKRMTMIMTPGESKLLMQNIYPTVSTSSLSPGTQFLGWPHHFDLRLRWISLQI